MANEEKYTHYGLQQERIAGGRDHISIGEGIVGPGEQLPEDAFPIASYSPEEVIEYKGKDGHLYRVTFDPNSPFIVGGVPVRVEEI